MARRTGPSSRTVLSYATAALLVLVLSPSATASYPVTDAPAAPPPGSAAPIEPTTRPAEQPPTRSDDPRTPTPTATPASPATPEVSTSPDVPRDDRPVASDDPEPEPMGPTPRAAAPPRRLLVGDSISWMGGGELRERQPGIVIDAVPGRLVGDLLPIVRDWKRTHGAPDTLVIALGSNASLGWSREKYDQAVRLMPPTTSVVLVSTFRIDGGMYPFGYAEQTRYSRWMHQVAAAHPNVCVAPWRAVVRDRPRYYLKDVVHPRPWAEPVWADTVDRAMRSCATRTSAAAASDRVAASDDALTP